MKRAPMTSSGFSFGRTVARLLRISTMVIKGMTMQLSSSSTRKKLILTKAGTPGTRSESEETASLAKCQQRRCKSAGGLGDRVTT